MGEFNKANSYKKIIIFILQVLFIFLTVVFLEYGELVIAVGLIIIIFGYWWKSRIFGGYEGSGFLIEHVYGLQYKIKNNIIKDINAEEIKAILSMKPALWAKNHFVDNYEDKFQSETMNKEEESTLLSLRQAIQVRNASIKIGFALTMVGVILLVV